MYPVPPLPSPPMVGLSFGEEMSLRLERLDAFVVWMDRQAFATFVEMGIWLKQKQGMLDGCFDLILQNTPGLTREELMIQLETDALLTEALCGGCLDSVVG